MKEDKEIENLLNEILTSYGKDVRDQFLKEVVPDIKEDLEFNFNGMNCDEECAWDGLSRRCYCDNRRVSWIYEYNMFFGETY
jgi:hypothetical protein